MKIILISIVLLVAFGCRKKANTDYEYYQPYKQDSIRRADSLARVDSIAKAAIEAEKLLQHQEEEKAKMDKGVDLNDKYLIVIASYTVESFAYEMKGKMQKEGYKADVFMTNNDGWYKLAIESYNDLIKAKTAVESIRGKGGLFKDAIVVSK